MKNTDFDTMIGNMVTNKHPDCTKCWEEYHESKWFAYAKGHHVCGDCAVKYWNELNGA